MSDNEKLMVIVPGGFTMMPKSPTQMLEEEHVVIAKVVSAASVIADRLEAGEGVDLDTLLGMVDFMRTFADRCHHGKEEELLFPLLGKKGVPLRGCPIGALTMEHVSGRMLVNGLAGAVDACKKGDPTGVEGIIQALRGIAELYPNHIWKEDYLLLPMSNKVLSLEDQQVLYHQFEQVEEQLGRDIHHHMEQFAEKLSESIQAG
jgi:hemerythrin-like domain-containing protein